MSKRAAPMSRGSAKSGGGISSNKHKKVPLNVGQRRVDAVSPAGSDQIGQALKNAAPLVEGRPKAASDLGNWTSEHCPAGPGGGRTVYESGSQTMTGKPSYGESQPVPDPSSVRNPLHSFPDDRPKRRA
jgi:hypothetical protein